MVYLKKYFLFGTAILLLTAFSAFQPSEADAILGKWKEKGGTKTIKIYKVENSYFGKLTENLSKDENKLKPGTVIMKDFIFDDDEWRGSIEVPTRDLKLKGKIILENENQIRSIASVAFIGKSKTWVRVR